MGILNWVLAPLVGGAKLIDLAVGSSNDREKREDDGGYSANPSCGEPECHAGHDEANHE